MALGVGHPAASVGVWRSAQGGTSGSWVKLMKATADYKILDGLAVDPASPTTVYVAAKGLGGVWRIEDAGNGGPRTRRILALKDAGPITVDAAGSLFAHDAGGSRLLQATAPRSATPSFMTVSDAFYADNNHNIRSLAIGPDGFVYTAANHAGVTVGVPSTSAP